MIFKHSALLVLLSALNYHCVSGAVVSLLVPDVDVEGTLTGKFLGTDAQGHTSWSVGLAVPSGNVVELPGFTLVEGATDVHQSISLELNLGVGTLTAVDVEGCAFATPTNGGAVAASCSVSGLAVGVIDGTATTSTMNSVYTTMATLVPVQVPDSGAGAIPSGAATASTPKGTGGFSNSNGSSPTSTSTKNGALKGGVNWSIVGPACIFIFLASFM